VDSRQHTGGEVMCGSAHQHRTHQPPNVKVLFRNLLIGILIFGSFITYIHRADMKTKANCKAAGGEMIVRHGAEHVCAVFPPSTRFIKE